MDRNLLLESANRLAHTSTQSADEYYRKSDQLIALMNTTMLKRPDVENLVGQNNIDMMQDNHANHVRFIASILKYPNPEVLVETVLWVFQAYRSHGFTTNYWAAQLNTWMDVLKQVLTDESYKEVYPYYEWMQTNIPLFVKISGEKA
ncbi:hypothetical protein [Geofilum rubicundum]|nr:hypothetical protein [Geofilum rubicundum]